MRRAKLPGPNHTQIKSATQQQLRGFMCALS
jgi:hypothetical protein